MWIPEVGEHAVALVLRDMAVKAFDHLGGGIVVGGDELDQIFRIELLAERSGFDEIAEDDRQMPAFCVRQRLLMLDDGPWSHCSPSSACDQNNRASARSYSSNFLTFCSETRGGANCRTKVGDRPGRRLPQAVLGGDAAQSRPRPLFT